MKTAIVIGATGLVGSELIKLLCANDNFAIVKASKNLKLVFGLIALLFQ